MNQFLSRKKPSGMQRQYLGWEKISGYLCPFLQKKLKIQFLLQLHSHPSHHFVASFVGAPENLASWSQGQTKFLFLDVETTKKKNCALFARSSPQSEQLSWVKLIVGTKPKRLFSSYTSNKATIWPTKVLRTFLQYGICVWHQWYKIWSQFYESLFVFQSC